MDIKITIAIISIILSILKCHEYGQNELKTTDDSVSFFYSPKVSLKVSGRKQMFQMFTNITIGAHERNIAKI